MLFDTRRPEWQPLYNPVSNLVYSATGSSVSEVFVAGERVVAEEHLTRIDETEVFDAVGDTAARIAERIGAERLTSLRWPVI